MRRCAGSGGFGSALIAQYTTRQRYTIGIFRMTIMKTNSQTIAPGSLRDADQAKGGPEPESPFAYLFETPAPVVVVPDPPEP
jgi:hypothetical protein